MNLTKPELKLVAAASFDAYRTSNARGFSLGRFCDLAGITPAQKLLDAGALLHSTSDTVHFSHHLLHDFLAARHVASLDPAEWTADVFDAISLQASSFDSVAMVFEHLSGRTADRLLECLYDWNLYAAGYALAEAINGLVAPSEEMQVLIYAMLAEKQFDLVLPSRQRVTDSLLVVKSSIASALANASSFDAVCEVVNKVTSTSDWFNSWRSLFTDVSTENISFHDVDSLCSVDSVLGWTMANVARRRDMTTAVRRDLISRLTAGSVAVRWRVAHVLGAFPTYSNSRVLLNLLVVDESDLVRYRALRSLVEMAARTGDPRLRSRVIHAIRLQIATIDRMPRLKAELCRTLTVHPLLAPREWRRVVVDVAREFYLRTEDPVARDQWRAYAAESAARYSAPSDPGWESTGNDGGIAQRVRALRDLYAAILSGTDEIDAAMAAIARLDRMTMARVPIVSSFPTDGFESRQTRARTLKTIESILQAEVRNLLSRSR